MGRTGGRRKKKRTHRPEAVDPAKKGPPKTFVWAHGKNRAFVKDLEQDLRQVMRPHTAVNLKVSRSNVLKDFVHVAGPLGVSHFVSLTATDKASYIKLSKAPRGPTVMLKILEFSLIRDVQAALAHPRNPADAYQDSPLVVLSGFTNDKPLRLTAVMLQNMFPSINVATTKVTQCKRALLLRHNPDTGTLSLRHYYIRIRPSGVNKAIKSVLEGKNLPDLSQLTDVAEFVERSGYGSESEGEEAGASRVNMPAAGGGGGTDGKQVSRVRLHEIGPRLELELVKIQAGLASGRVLYHKYDTRSQAKVDEQEAAAQERERLRAARRKEQEENVKLKAREAARVKVPAKDTGGVRRTERTNDGPQKKVRKMDGKRARREV